MRKFLKWMILIMCLAALTALIIFLLIRLTPQPPAGDIEYARETLAEAAASKAGTYSKKLYTEAKAAFDSAMETWHNENKRFIYFRDYDKVKSYALVSAKKARQAAESSLSNSNNLKIRLKDKIDTLKVTESSIDRYFSRYPLAEEIRSRISRGRMLLREGEVAFSKGQYLTSNRKITDAEYLLTSVYETATEELKNYFRSYPLWKKWVQSAITESGKNNSYSVIVDKFSRKCYLYLGGEKKYEFDAELGRNWVGDKHSMGDKATPEGNYRITNKLQGRQTPYHKSLPIDYPNAADKERFKNGIANGTLPASAKIGNGIEIHGGGGRGVDWTEGCIALTNSEIDLIFSLVKTGTPVTIVGSMKDIDEILSK